MFAKTFAALRILLTLGGLSLMFIITAEEVRDILSRQKAVRVNGL